MAVIHTYEWGPDAMTLTPLPKLPNTDATPRKDRVITRIPDYFNNLYIRFKGKSQNTLIFNFENLTLDQVASFESNINTQTPVYFKMTRVVDGVPTTVIHAGFYYIISEQGAIQYTNGEQLKLATLRLELIKKQT